MICTARIDPAQQSVLTKGVTQKRPIAPILAPDLSFGHWVPSMDDDDDTASSSSADSKAAQLAEESLMCDEEIGECTQPPAKRQRSSSDGIACNISPPEPSRFSWLLDATPQILSHQVIG
ncbi:g8306 [Coccomyxa elongata]